MKLNIIMKRSFLISLSIITLLITFIGCIKEDLSNCKKEGIYLKLRHANRNQDRWIELEDINRLTLYAYNPQGLLQHTIDMTSMQVIDEHTLYVPIQHGDYQFVIWIGAKDEYYTMLAVEPGRSNLSESQLQLNRNGANEVLPRPSELYYSRLDSVTVNHAEIHNLVANITRFTSNIRIFMRGLENQEESDHSFVIEDDNGTTGFEDLSIVNDDILTYFPEYGSISRASSSLIGYFTVMKLQQGRHPLLKLYSGDNVLEEEWDLMDELLVKYPEADFTSGGDYEIIFTFSAGYLAFSITINGWEIVDEEITQ